MLCSAMATSDPSPGNALPSTIDENIGTIADYCERNEQRATPAQKIVEKISLFLGSAAYFAVNALFIACWIAWNASASIFDLPQPDEPPFF